MIYGILNDVLLSKRALVINDFCEPKNLLYNMTIIYCTQCIYNLVFKTGPQLQQLMILTSIFYFRRHHVALKHVGVL